MPILDASFAEGDDRRLIHCLHCGQPQSVSRLALTVNCRHCNKLLKIEDVTIRQYQARRSIETCGMLTIEKDGNVFSDHIACGSLVVRGHLRGNVVSRGPVFVGARAEIRGNVTAPTLAVGDGAVLEGDYRIGPAVQ